MKKLLYVLILAVIAPHLSAFADDIKRERKLPAFSSLNISGAFIVYFTQGDEDRVSVEASERMYDKIITEVKGRTLHIKLEPRMRFRNPGRMAIYIQSDDLEVLDISGACKFYTKNTLSAKNFNMDLSGASKIEMDITAEKISLDASGASKLKISGKTEELKLDLSGASSIQSKDLVSDNVKIDASGASSISLNVQKSLKAELSGASKIRYLGSPEHYNVDASGASSVKKL
ncbi:MAG: DUF2807 domain-containing protein [Cytophagales bacterium]|nr:DUF2807 domain-containing protein [Cytophagales bacterium]